MQNLIAGLMLVISGIYLLNFSAGILELPDYLPIIGNLDEAAASLVFISALKHFGYDLTAFLPFGRKQQPRQKTAKA